MNTNLSIGITASVREAIAAIDKSGLGIIFLEENNQVLACATDGDIRRFLLSNGDLSAPIQLCANYNFTYLFEDYYTRENALKLLDSKVKVVPILNSSKQILNVVTAELLDWHSDNKVISKAKSPVRISFGGGGTDLTNYFYENSGVVLNATISKYAHATLVKRKDDRIAIRSNDLNIKVECDHIDGLKYDGKLDLIKSVIKVLRPNFGFELLTSSDVPAGSGLGGSAVLLSAVIGAFNNFRDEKYDSYEIAELAFHAERIELGLSGGWQDQYATVFGGFNFMEFHANENIVHPLRISEETLLQLEDSLILCYSGQNHNSGKIHDEQKNNMTQTDIKEYAERSKQITFEMKSRLLKNQLDGFGELLHQAWQIKKRFSNQISSNELDEIYDCAMANGATGGKLLGAGGGGYFLFYVPTLNKFETVNALRARGLAIENFTFDLKGLKTWTQRIRKL